MTSITAPYLHTEARLNIEPITSSSTLQIPTETSSFFSGRKRARVNDDVDLDEEAYARKHIASEASVFFRRADRAPRSFLWRVLDDRRLLEIQSVDLVQDRKATQESVLTFALSFTNQIRPNGVAFADPLDHDALNVFVLTTNNELYTFTLRKELLLRTSAKEIDPSTCFKSFTPSSFSFRHPYKLVVLSSLELLVSLHDGGLLRLERKAGDNGSSWRETFFSEGGWSSSLRGLIPWKGHNTVRFGNVDLEPAATIAASASPDGQHVFTVSLDHTLKAWNTKTGKVGIQTDMLGENRIEGSQVPNYLIDPSQESLMRVLQPASLPDGDMYNIVTASPKDHQFKFWAVRDADSLVHGIRDLHPDIRFVPPIDELMNTNVWQLADFHVSAGSGWKNSQLWIRARSGAECKIFTLVFDLLGPVEDLEDAWRNRWIAVEDGSWSIDRLIKSSQYPRAISAEHNTFQSASHTDQWIDFLFWPGCFSVAMLESALHIYRKGLNMLTKSRAQDATKPLKERLCNAVLAQIQPRRDTNGQIDINRYHSDVAAQWTVFFGLVRHLYQSRTDSLSLAFDTSTSLCWSVRADQIAPIRACSEVEIFALNEDIFASEEEWIVNSLPLAEHLADQHSIAVARLLAAARNFRGSLSAGVNQQFEDRISVYALRDGDAVTEKRSRRKKHDPTLTELYDHCNFANEVGDEDFNNLTEAVEELGGLGELENETFIAALDRLAEESHGRTEEQALTRYGDKTTIRVAQDTLLLGHDTLLDLMSLVTFISQDLEPDELSEHFKASELYALLISRIREYDVLLWLASNVRQESTPKRRESVGGALSSAPATAAPSLTVFESIFIGDWPSLRFPEVSLPSLITYWSRAWTFGPSLGTAYDGVTAHIMSNLLKHENYRLAQDFSRFLPTNAWATYLRARLSLAEGEHDFAAEYFKQASSTLAEKRGLKVEAIDTASLLSPTQRELFADGLPRYYIHVASLFEAARLFSYTADFANLALRQIESESEDQLDSSIADVDRRKQSMGHGSPAAAQVDLAMEEIRLLRLSESKDDVLSRLFNAALQTARWETAFGALVKFGNPAFRRASLQQFLQAILAKNELQTLLSLDVPFPLVAEIDSILLSLVQKHTSSTSSLTSSSILRPSNSFLSDGATDTTSSIPPYERILYAYRVHNSNMRGAAEVLHARLERLRLASRKAKDFDPDDTGLLDAYLVLINTLACCGREEGWILVSPSNDLGTNGGVTGKRDSGFHASAKRRIVTLEDVRREYQAELDRRSEMAHGRFAITSLEGADEMDVL